MDDKRGGLSNHEEKETRILEKINGVLRRLGSSERKNLQVIRGTDALRGKRITILDDEKPLLGIFVPVFLSATEGEGDFVLHQGESADEVARQIIAQVPDIVLLDYDLQKGVKGTNVAIELRNQGYSGVVLIFSSIDRTKSKDYPADKIDGSVIKGAGGIADSVRGVANFVRTKETS